MQMQTLRSRFAGAALVAYAMAPGCGGSGAPLPGGSGFAAQAQALVESDRERNGPSGSTKLVDCSDTRCPAGYECSTVPGLRGDDHRCLRALFGPRAPYRPIEKQQRGSATLAHEHIRFVPGDAPILARPVPSVFVDPTPGDVTGGQ